MKKHLFILGLAMLLSATSAFAQGGTTGPLTWNISYGTLTISGEGEMPDYVYNADCAPWFQYENIIKKVIIEDGVTSVGNNAFHGCYTLTSIVVPSSVTSIGEYAFAWCNSLTAVNIPDGITTIRDGVFHLCSRLTSIDIPNNVTSIGYGSFIACNGLTSIIIPENVTSIGPCAFASCNGFTTIVIPDGVTTIGESAFSNCKGLTSMIIPDGITSIEKSMFAECNALTSIVIPNSVTSIGEYAFSGCKALTSVINLNPIPVNITSDVFSYVNVNNCILKVPTDAIADYKNAEVWKEFKIIGEDEYLVKVNINNNKYGDVIGDGAYQEDATATVEAIAHDGYHFVNWTKDGVEISTDNPYRFTVTEDIELVANFEENVGIVAPPSPPEGGDVRIYPNPTTGLLMICDMRYAICDNRTSDIGQSEIVIYDVMGRVVHVETHGRASLQSQITPPPAPLPLLPPAFSPKEKRRGKDFFGGEFRKSEIGQSHIEIDISHLPQGVYGVSVISNGRVVGNGKVVKM
ncbi:MAG: leucine-rich repeat protein [Bacteroidales bacterium]|nr:leucine-rich repeat protein [Bacteroidales bacterium]